MKEVPENQRVIYEFGRFVLDPDENTLLTDGQPIHLPSKEFDVLRLLVENNGRVVTKEEMMEKIWPDTFVEENNLAKYVSRLRRLLSAGSEITIETLPKHGYRFSANVNEVFQPVEETILEKRTKRPCDCTSGRGFWRKLTYAGRGARSEETDREAHQPSRSNCPDWNRLRSDWTRRCRIDCSP
jgi:DNA-binding winged helix-turn-helix (wHTH) protein